MNSKFTVKLLPSIITSFLLFGCNEARNQRWEENNEIQTTSLYNPQNRIITLSKEGREDVIIKGKCSMNVAFNPEGIEITCIETVKDGESYTFNYFFDETYSFSVQQKVSK